MEVKSEKKHQKVELPLPWRKKLLPPSELEEKVSELRDQNLSIATLNGSFDLMHAGHLHILNEAKNQADVLIVALNSDESIKQYKSKNRPIIPLVYRLQMLSAIECVDYVTWFEETNPCNLLTKILPDVHVNGAEYGSNCIEADVVEKGGGRVHIVDLIPGLATSQVIQKIVKTYETDRGS